MSRRSGGDWYTDAAPGAPPSGGNNEVPANDDSKQLRGSVRESDSDYVKLSKQGGRKDLLQYDEQVATNPVKLSGNLPWEQNQKIESQEPMKSPYGRKMRQESQMESSKQDWKAPDYMVHDNTNNGNGPSTTVGSTGGNQDVNWARKQCETNQRKYSHREAPFHTTDYDPNKEGSRTQHGRKTFDRPNAGKEVSFSKLMSGGYGNDGEGVAQE